MCALLCLAFVYGFGGRLKSLRLEDTDFDAGHRRSRLAFESSPQTLTFRKHILYSEVLQAQVMFTEF